MDTTTDPLPALLERARALRMHPNYAPADVDIPQAVWTAWADVAGAVSAASHDQMPAGLRVARTQDLADACDALEAACEAAGIGGPAQPSAAMLAERARDLLRRYWDRPDSARDVPGMGAASDVTEAALMVAQHSGQDDAAWLDTLRRRCAVLDVYLTEKEG